MTENILTFKQLYTLVKSELDFLWSNADLKDLEALTKVIFKDEQFTRREALKHLKEFMKENSSDDYSYSFNYMTKEIKNYLYEHYWKNDYKTYKPFIYDILRELYYTEAREDLIPKSSAVSKELYYFVIDRIWLNGIKTDPFLINDNISRFGIHNHFSMWF
jgi:hypothetical protein